MLAAKQKKEKMLALEAQKKAEKPKTVVVEEKQQRETVNTRAQEILNEQMDEVKDMNKMVKYTKIASIRDKQLRQKSMIREMQVQEEKRKDLMWEIERLKVVKSQDEMQRVKKVEQRQVCDVMVEQMKEKERKRLHEREVDEFEGIEIAKAVRLAEEAEREVLKEKKSTVARHKQMVRESEHNEALLKE